MTQKSAVSVESSPRGRIAVRRIDSCVIALALLLTSCSASLRCVDEDLGGWMVDEESTHGVHHYCTDRSERFVLREVTKRRPDASVAEWADVATLDVPLQRHETTMFGLECGSEKGKRGDAIAVVRYRRDGSFEIKRAWLVDVVDRAFVVVPVHRVVCESIE